MKPSPRLFLLAVPIAATLSVLPGCAAGRTGEKESSTVDAAKADAAEAKDAKEAKDADEDTPADKLKKKQFELDNARRQMKITRLECEAEEREAKAEIEDAEFKRKHALTAVENFRNRTKPKELEEAQLIVDHSTQRLREAKSEMDELKTMYHGDTFADLTKDLVVQRHEMQIAFAERDLVQAHREFDLVRDYELAKKESDLGEELEKAERALKEATAKQDRVKEETELKRRKAENEIDEGEAAVKKLQAKVDAAKKKEEDKKKAAEKQAAEKQKEEVKK